MNALCLVVLLTVAAVVSGEQCQDTSDCNHVTCDAGHALECHRSQCTCHDAGQTCTNANDCSGNCRFNWHCVDGGCRCGFGIGGIGK